MLPLLRSAGCKPWRILDGISDEQLYNLFASSYGGAILNASEEMRQLPDAGELTLKGRLEAR